MTDVIDRISQLMNLRGVKARSIKPTLARVCGISYQAVSQWFDGSTSNIKNEHLMALAEEYGTTVDWLLSGKGDAPEAKPLLAATPKSPAELVREMLSSKPGGMLSEEARKRIMAAAAEPSTPIAEPNNVIVGDFSRSTIVKGDTISIAQYDVRAAMGAGQVPAEYREFVRNLVVDKVQLDDLGIKYTAPTNLKIITGWGQSMLGTIDDKSPLIVDIGVTDFVEEGVYVFTWLQHLFIKRVQLLDAEHFQLVSDNKVFEPQKARMEDMHFHAKVLGTWNFQRL